MNQTDKNSAAAAPMYHSSSSSSPHRPPGPPTLTRYVSAPGSLLNRLTESVISENEFHSVMGSDHTNNLVSSFFNNNNNTTGDSPCHTSESTCKPPDIAGNGGGGLQRSYGMNEMSVRDLTAEIGGNTTHDPKVGGSNLMRHSSSPAGFFNHLMLDNGFSVTTGMRHYPQPAGNGAHAMASTRLKSQLSFSRQEKLSQISEISMSGMGESVVGGNSSDETAGNVGQSYISGNYPISSWDDTNSIAFSVPSSKRAKESNEDIFTSLNNIDSQFSLPTTSLEMATVEKLLQAQEDNVPFKVRAKRGCATHPRSIAERERRTRISEKLRKLQELVPNMDKQTSTADMLDLAVHHIKELQKEVQNLNQERANCTCACKEEVL